MNPGEMKVKIPQEKLIICLQPPIVTGKNIKFFSKVFRENAKGQMELNLGLDLGINVTFVSMCVGENKGLLFNEKDNLNSNKK